MKTYDIKEIKAQITKAGYQHITLKSRDEKKLVPYNQNPKEIDKRLGEIEVKLERDETPEGLYHIFMCHRFGNGEVPDMFPIIKGEWDGEAPPPVVEFIEVKEDKPSSNGDAAKVRSYDATMKDRIEIERLKNQIKTYQEVQDRMLTEVKTLQEENTRLEDELYEAEEDLSEHETSGGANMESGLAFLDGVMPQISDMMDKYFQNQGVKNYIELIKFQKEQGIPISPPSGGDANPPKNAKYPFDMKVPNNSGEWAVYTIRNKKEHQYALQLIQQNRDRGEESEEEEEVEEVEQEAVYEEVEEGLGEAPDAATDPEGYNNWLMQFAMSDPSGYTEFMSS